VRNPFDEEKAALAAPEERGFRKARFDILGGKDREGFPNTKGSGGIDCVTCGLRQD
jgi:hypothetical protein